MSADTAGRSFGGRVPTVRRHDMCVLVITVHLPYQYMSHHEMLFMFKLSDHTTSVPVVITNMPSFVVCRDN